MYFEPLPIYHVVIVRTSQACFFAMCITCEHWTGQEQKHVGKYMIDKLFRCLLKSSENIKDHHSMMTIVSLLYDWKIVPMSFEKVWENKNIIIVSLKRSENIKTLFLCDHGVRLHSVNRELTLTSYLLSWSLRIIHITTIIIIFVTLIVINTTWAFSEYSHDKWLCLP